MKDIRPAEQTVPSTGPDFAHRRLAWELTKDDAAPYRSVVDGQEWVVRVNDFPDEHLYTLLVDGREVQSFDGWPAAWLGPDEPSIDPFRDDVCLALVTGGGSSEVQPDRRCEARLEPDCSGHSRPEGVP